MLGYHPSNTSLVKLVPAHHFYQQLLAAVDFSFIRPLFVALYSSHRLTPSYLLSYYW